MSFNANINVGNNFSVNSTLVTINNTPLSANGTTGTTGQVLASNGAVGSPYWTTSAPSAPSFGPLTGDVTTASAGSTATTVAQISKGLTQFGQSINDDYSMTFFTYYGGCSFSASGGTTTITLPFPFLGTTGSYNLKYITPSNPSSPVRYTSTQASLTYGSMVATYAGSLTGCDSTTILEIENAYISGTPIVYFQYNAGTCSFATAAGTTTITYPAGLPSYPNAQGGYGGVNASGGFQPSTTYTAFTNFPFEASFTITVDASGIATFPYPADNPTFTSATVLTIIKTASSTTPIIDGYTPTQSASTPAAGYYGNTTLSWLINGSATIIGIQPPPTNSGLLFLTALNGTITLGAGFSGYNGMTINGGTALQLNPGGTAILLYNSATRVGNRTGTGGWLIVGALGQQGLTYAAVYGGGTYSSVYLPSGFDTGKVFICGGGGGGGAGYKANTTAGIGTTASTSYFGGNGGDSGCWSVLDLGTGLFRSTLNLGVGVGGTGGIAVTTGGPGGSGSSGGDSWATYNGVTVIALGGNGGLGGTSGAGQGAQSAKTSGGNLALGLPGGTGSGSSSAGGGTAGNGANVANAPTSGAPYTPGAGGGGGGYFYTSGTVSKGDNGGNGGYPGLYYSGSSSSAPATTSAAGGAGCPISGTTGKPTSIAGAGTPTSVSFSILPIVGGGGGGGGSAHANTGTRLGGTSSNGAAGGAPGGGGGGGGASRATTATASTYAGGGGNGGDGVAIIAIW